MRQFRWTNTVVVLLTAGLVFALSAISISPPQAARAATVIYVTPTGSDEPGCGNSWSDACTLQAALNRGLAGDEIWVATGLYIPGESSDRFATFLVPAGVGLYGGFAGTETEREQRDPTVNPTILSGDLDRNDVDRDGMVQSWEDIRGENAYHVVTFDTRQPVDAGTVMDGFVITGGQADGLAPDDRGGGLLCPYALERAECSPTLRHLLITGNSAGYGGGLFTQAVGDAVNQPVLAYVTFRGNHATVSGGGLYSQNESYPVLTEVMFEGNVADTGGGLYSGSNRALAGIKLSRVDFRNNYAESAGGGVYLFAAVAEHSATFSDVTFFGNHATYGGGLFKDASRGDIELTVTQTTFESNQAKVDGGGVAHSTADGGRSRTSFTDVTFIRNQADGSGGALSGSAGIGIVEQTFAGVTVSGNRANDDGGGFYCTADATGRCDLTLTNALFSGNLAGGDGGGISLHALAEGSSGARLVNATFAANEAQRGGAIASRVAGSSRLEVINSILWGNSAATGAEIYDNSTDAAPVLRYSLVEGRTNDAENHVWGDRDPRFVAPARAAAPTTGGDYRLQLSSPAIDAGDNESVPEGITTDLNGAPRFVDVPSVPNTGNGTPPIVDMGAYEYCGTATPNMRNLMIFLPVVASRPSQPATTTRGENR